jgi:hypothetical protein
MSTLTRRTDSTEYMCYDDDKADPMEMRRQTV